MKKLLFILILCLSVSCSSDNEGEHNDGLKGTVWCSDVNGRSELKFISDSECHLFMDYYNLEEDSYFNYSEKDSYIELYHKDNLYHDVICKLKYNDKGNLLVIECAYGLYLVELIRKK